MRPLLIKLALLMLAPSLVGKSLILESKRLPARSMGRSIASISDIQKELENTIKEKLDKKIAERDLAKKEVEQNEKDDNCKDELLASQAKLKKLEAEVKELESYKIPQSNQDLVNCLAQSKPSVLSSAIASLIAQQQYTLSMYNEMQNLLLGYQIQNLYFEISKPTYSDLGQQPLSLNSILGANMTSPWTQPQQPLPQIQGYNFTTDEDQASEAYNRMVPDVSRNPMYSPNWGGFTLEQNHIPPTEGFNFGIPSTYQFDTSVTDVSKNPMYQPGLNNFDENFGNDIPVSNYNFN